MTEMTEIRFWKDEKREKMDPALFSVKANEFAERLSKNKGTDKRTQIRKFYEEVIRLDMDAKKREWDDMLPFVHMLMAKAAYAKGRKLVSEDFFKFIESSVKQISEPKDLSVFANFFEAFMGFYKMYRPTD